jgi:hypothetical protein
LQEKAGAPQAFVACASFPTFPWPPPAEILKKRFSGGAANSAKYQVSIWSAQHLELAGSGFEA